jgi:hypothetical protein
VTAEESAVAEARPLLQVVRGTPDDAELAALTAVVLALSGGDSPPPVTPSLWRDRSAVVHAPIAAGRGAWRASGLPR